MPSSAYKLAFFLLLLLGLTSCNELAVIYRTSFTISDVAVQDGKIQFTGTGLTNVKMVTGNSSNLDGFNMKIVDKSNTTLVVEFNHASLNSLEIARGSVLSFIVSNGRTQTTVNLTVAPVVPTGAIVAFNGACPSGWNELTSAKGRVFVGAGSGNTDALGSPLTARTLAAVGGLEYTTGIPANADTNVTEPIATPSLNLGVMSFSYFLDSFPANSTFSGVKADSNLPPFVVVRQCEKI